MKQLKMKILTSPSEEKTMQKLIVPSFEILKDDPEGHKYELLEDFGAIFVKALKDFSLQTEYAKIDRGMVTIKKGYRWNGNSGPAIDNTTVLVAGMVHDALYKYIKECIVSNKGPKRRMSDAAYSELIDLYGGNWAREKYHWLGVRLFGWRHV
jgi:hypothetical protein